MTLLTFFAVIGLVVSAGIPNFWPISRHSCQRQAWVLRISARPQSATQKSSRGCGMVGAYVLKQRRRWQTSSQRIPGALAMLLEDAA